jgi:predicted transposase/invertase (TIGR01784 family)
MVYFSKLVAIERDAFRDLVSELPKHKQPNVMTLYDSIIEEGIEKGLQKGREEGREETKKQTVLTGYKNGVSIDILCLLTGYSEVEVLQILAEAEDANQA